MNNKGLSSYEIIAIVFGVFVFIFLSFLVIFQQDWLDSIFYGSSPTEVEIKEPLPFPDEPEKDDSSLISLAVFSDIDREGEAYVILETQFDYSVSGLELFLRKDDSLEIGDFVCVEPFECIFFETTPNEFSLTAVVPVESIEPASTKELLVGSFSYTGFGNLYLTTDSDSFVSDVDEPEYNILDLQEYEFFLK